MIANLEMISANSTSTVRIAQTRRAGHTIAQNTSGQHQHDDVNGELADDELAPEREPGSDEHDPGGHGDERVSEAQARRSPRRSSPTETGCRPVPRGAPIPAESASVTASNSIVTGIAAPVMTAASGR